MSEYWEMVREIDDPVNPQPFLEVLTRALEIVGSDPDGCRFAGSDGPDHHGPEFAAALLQEITEEFLRREGIPWTK